jgi:MFS family permease
VALTGKGSAKGALDFLKADPRLAAFGLFMAFGSSFGQTFFISQFGGEIRREFDLSDGAFGTIYGLGTLCSAAALIYTGSLIDRIDLRRWTVCLIPACAAACLAMATVQGPVTLFLAVFLLRQTGQGLMSHTMGHSLGRYSRVGRGKAIAFGGYGFPLGEALFPILGVAAIAALGWRETWFLLAGLYLIAVLPLARALLSDHEARYAQYRADTDAEERGDATNRPRARRQWRRREVLRDPRFYLALPGLLAPSFIITGLLLHGVRIAETKGWGTSLWAESFVFYAIASVPAGILFGALVDRYGAARGLGFFLPPQILGCLAIGFGEAGWTAPLFMALSGMTAGMTAVLMVALWAEAYGTRYLGEIKALITALAVFASAAAPPLMGAMLDLDWSVRDIALFSAAYAALGAGLSVLAMRAYSRDVES